MNDQQAIDALALQTLQVAGSLSPADQHRAFSAVASRDIAAMAAIVAMSKGGIVAGRDVVINVNSGNTSSHREDTQVDGRATFEGLDGRTVLACFAVMLAILATVKIGETATNFVHAIRGERPTTERISY